jgi:hypothetical protein
MPEIGTSGLMSGVGKRGGALRQCSRPTSTLPDLPEPSPNASLESIFHGPWSAVTFELQIAD